MTTSPSDTNVIAETNRYVDSALPIFQHNRGHLPIEFFGHPFIIESSETKHCLHGSAKDSRGGKNADSCDGEHDYGMSYRRFQGTRKLDCPATIQIRGIRVFDSYSLDKTSCTTPYSLKTTKQKMLDRLIEDLETQTPPSSTLRYFIRVPLFSQHKGHPVGAAATVNQLVDNKVVAKIYELVGKGITRADEVKRCLDEFVERELFPTSAVRPKRTNRAYYPNRKDLQNHIGRAISASRYSHDDQESLKKKVEEWQASGSTANFFYRTKSAVTEGESGKDGGNDGSGKDNFLFVHQEEWQQRLLCRYGSELVLMDATYKTTKYSLPLFFVCVHTNVGYRVVAEFISEHEDSHSIAEALEILKRWNPWWKPLYFMVDYSTAEINAIEREFPGAMVYICDFHRLQAWKRWIPKNGLNALEQAALLSLLKRVADARQRHQHDTAVSDLRRSPVYTSSEATRTYVEKVWMSCVERWAQAFRKQQVLNIVNTNNGVEAQNKLFKYSYLPKSVDKSAYGIVVLLVESFLPDSYKNYCDMNLKQSSQYRRITNLPGYLHNRPRHFVKNCLKSRVAAGEFEVQDIQCVDISKGEFRVKASNDAGRLYSVTFQAPSCTCEAWYKTYFPCKHMYAVFKVFDEWSFARLPEKYRNSVFITLDDYAFGIAASSDDNYDSVTIDQPVSTVSCTEMTENAECRNSVFVILDDNGFGIAASSGDNYDSVTIDQPVSTVSCTKMTENAAGPSTLTRSSTSLRNQFLQKLNLVRDIVYRVDDEACLQDAIVKMGELQRNLWANSSTDNGLPLRLSPVKKRRRD
ncbi:PREDICTED: uncharacterized protein LOC106810784 [Priapulus caudatus]|uniref:Uncharacterized protein LOC106810784 n=1 Tax=Priapulus caudatus TaxID=37621 RepID=A0ABM1EBZ5_PRICU|nr:PREDICTED: uncharacterized protein LOC106810784 [Priapulus caudatus]